MSQTPTVYFIDDSATMREVIKIAFRRENMNVVACNSGTTAVAELEQVKPDVVISDVIMPEKDGYEVCQFIKQNSALFKTPVILMSGVVNRAVAEKAFAVKADELIRKPFQPQDLINRVRHLLDPKTAAAKDAPPVAVASAALSSIFATPTSGLPMHSRPAFGRGPSPLPPVPGGKLLRPPIIRPGEGGRPAAALRPGPPIMTPGAIRTPASIPAGAHAGPSDIQKLKVEVLRLEGLVKKLQTELHAERDYTRALEEHIKTLQEAD